MYMPNYHLSKDGYDELPEVLASRGFKKAVLVGGKRALDAASGKIKDALEGTDTTITGSFVYGVECTDANIERLMKEPAVQEADIIFGIGGGKALDTAKVLSLRVDKPAFSFPTICSNCAAMTAIAVVYHEDGRVRGYEFPKSPSDIFIDLKIIAEAPEIYFWAGIGDGISKQAEVLSASKGDDLSHMARLGVGIAKTCEEPFLKWAKEGLEDVKHNRVSRAVEEIALDVLVSTGYVSNLTNQPDFYYNSYIAHIFFDAACLIPREGNYLHGEVVSFGVMVLHAYDDNEAELEKIARFNQSIGLPITLEDVGLTAGDLDEMMTFVPKTTEAIRSSKPISIEKIKSAALTADAYGRSLK